METQSVREIPSDKSQGEGEQIERGRTWRDQRNSEGNAGKRNILKLRKKRDGQQ